MKAAADAWKSIKKTMYDAGVAPQRIGETMSRIDEFSRTTISSAKRGEFSFNSAKVSQLVDEKLDLRLSGLQSSDRDVLKKLIVKFVMNAPALQASVH
jgi:hypothetical protein